MKITNAGILWSLTVYLTDIKEPLVFHKHKLVDKYGLNIFSTILLFFNFAGAFFFAEEFLIGLEFILENQV